jgi:nucleoside-diphosphate-sugar epimerase
VRVLIAGCGDVGTRAGLLLAAEGHEVHGITRRGVLPAPLIAHAHDLIDPTARFEAGAFDALVWCPTPSTRDEPGYRAVFIDAPLRLLDRLPQAPRRLVFVSSTAVWGDAGGAWVDEDTPAHPDGYNGAVLLEAEALLAARVPGTVSLRLAGIYGPGRTRMIDRARAGAPVQSEPPAWTNRIHVDDAAAAVALLVQSDAQGIVTGVDDEPVPEHVVLAWIAAKLGQPAPPAVAGPAPANKRLSNRRLRALGWRPCYPDFRSGYAAMLAATSADAPPSG